MIIESSKFEEKFNSTGPRWIEHGQGGSKIPSSGIKYRSLSKNRSTDYSRTNTRAPCTDSHHINLARVHVYRSVNWQLILRQDSWRGITQAPHSQGCHTRHGFISWWLSTSVNTMPYQYTWFPHQVFRFLQSWWDDNCVPYIHPKGWAIITFTIGSVENWANHQHSSYIKGRYQNHGSSSLCSNSSLESGL